MKFENISNNYELENFDAQISEWIERDKTEIISFFSRLVKCKTPSEPGDTRNAVKLIKKFLDDRGLPCKEVTKNEIMPNIISSITMNQSGRHLMFNGHLDVMPAGNEPGWTDDPWSGKIYDKKVWGRGSSDMKAGVTAMLFAYSYLSQFKKQLSGKLSLTLVSDEETGYDRGTGHMFERIEQEMLADCVLAGEPSGIDTISFSSKGYMQFTVKIKTRGAIAGYKNESKSAIYIASSVINDLKRLENIEVKLPDVLSDMLSEPLWQKEYENRRSRSEAELLSKITVDITTINGGDMISVIAPECTFTAAVVMPVGTDAYYVFSEANRIISNYPEAELILDGISTADISDPNHEMVKIIQDVVSKSGYKKPIPVPDIAISDCRHWRYRNIPSFWYGPDGSRCSAANEYVSIDELLHLVRTHAMAAVRYLEAPAKKNVHNKKPLPNKSHVFGELPPKITTLPPVYAACLTSLADSFKKADLDPVADELINTLYSSLTEAGILVGASAIIIMEQQKNKDKKQITVTAAIPIERSVVSGGGFEVRELPSVKYAAVAVHRGAGSTSASWSALCRWAADQGYKDCGIYREYYIVGAPNPKDQWAAELQLVLKK